MNTPVPADPSGLIGSDPDWDIRVSLEETIRQIVEAWRTKLTP